MYFITEKNSETGKKFQKIADKLDACFENQKALAEKYGFTSWRGERWVVAGGISSAIFPQGTTVDTKVWKLLRGKDEYMPRLNTKQGKAIQADFDQAITVTKAELNACIGWDEGFSKNIGFNKSNDKYFAFIIDEDWDITIPNDCKEITTTKFRELFKITNNDEQ